MYERPTVSLPKSEKKTYVFCFMQLTDFYIDFFKLKSDLWNELYIYFISLTCLHIGNLLQESSTTFMTMHSFLASLLFYEAPSFDWSWAVLG